MSDTCKFCDEPIGDDAEMRVCADCAAMMCGQCGVPCEECDHGVIPLELVRENGELREVVLGPRVKLLRRVLA